MTILASIVAVCVYETISGYPRARSTIDGELLRLELLTIENQRDGLSPVGDGVERMFRVRFTATVFPEADSGRRYAHELGVDHRTSPIGTDLTDHRFGGSNTMSETLPVVYLARHGETAWTLSGQHTGLTDLPLTDQGECNARQLGQELRGRQFARIFTSPLQRAARTCELAGFGVQSEVDRDLVEWNYGEYEGLRTADIHAKRPHWQIFRDGCPGGESPAEIGARADRVVERVRAVGRDVLIFSSGHFLRVLTARWLGLESQAGEYFLLSTASLSALSYEHDLSQPAIQLWNDLHHLTEKHNR